MCISARVRCMALHMIPCLQAEVALHKREAVSGRSPMALSMARDGADRDSHEASTKKEIDAAQEKVAHMQTEVEELSNSLAKATSVIEV